MGWSNEKEEFICDGLDKFKEKLFKYKYVVEMEFDGLKEDCWVVLLVGIVIFYVIFDVFELDKLVYLDGVLCEGVMYDLLGCF